MEKILIRDDRNKAVRMINELQEKCNCINAVIPRLFKENDIPLTAENVEKAVLSPNSIKKVYQDSLNDKIKDFPRVVQVVARQEAECVIENILNELRELELNDSRYRQFVVFSGTTCKVDEDAIKESCKCYLTTTREIEVYNNIQYAADMLNKLFGGDIPLNWINIFRAENGKLIVNKDLNFEYFVKGK